MITKDIYGAFKREKNSLIPGEVKGNFMLTQSGIYLYRHPHNGLAEIIEFADEESENTYIAKCIEIHNKYFEL